MFIEETKVDKLVSFCHFSLTKERRFWLNVNCIVFHDTTTTVNDNSLATIC